MGRKCQPCIVCGRKIARKIKLPNGSIHLCTDRDCLDALNYRTNDGSVPIVWFSMEDLNNHEVLDETIFEHFRTDEATAIEIAKDVDEYVWSGETQGEMFHDACVEAGQKLETNYVAMAKDKDLPLIQMGSLKSEEAKALLERRLKGINKGPEDTIGDVVFVK